MWVLGECEGGFQDYEGKEHSVVEFTDILWPGMDFSCFERFLRMNEEGVPPTSTTVSKLLMVCSQTSHIRCGKFVHGYVLRNHIKVDIFVETSVIDLYFKCGNVDFAEPLLGRCAREMWLHGM